MLRIFVLNGIIFQLSRFAEVVCPLRHHASSSVFGKLVSRFSNLSVEDKTQVVLYSKPGCHLCEEMKQEIARAGYAELYSLTEINIETNPDLLAKYKYDIPVLLIDEIESFRHRLKVEDFIARILAAQKQRAHGN